MTGKPKMSLILGVLCILCAVLFCGAIANAGDEVSPEKANGVSVKCEGDSDCDGLSDGIEKKIGTDPDNPDTDGDGLLDGEEEYVGPDKKLGPDETDVLKADTDGDGVDDGEEKRIGTRANVCDTDGDSISDGVELGKIQPKDINGCHGLQAAGTNFKRPHMLDPKNPDSDGDGLSDGEEDLNGNGWLESNETDPTIIDTDGDGLSDAVETMGDFDDDGFSDFDFKSIRAGQKCSPPQAISDLDCDGVPNSRDLDSDNDSCPDNEEGGWLDKNNSGIPDVFDNQAKLCPDEVVPSSSNSGSKQQTEENEISTDNSFMSGLADEAPACAVNNANYVSIAYVLLNMWMFIGLVFLLILAKKRI